MKEVCMKKEEKIIGVIPARYNSSRLPRETTF